jgi:hypothetical protein
MKTVRPRRNLILAVYEIASHLGSAALTDGRRGCQTVVGRIEEKNTSAAFSSAVRPPHNKRTMEAGLWGIWAFRPKAE